jgi:hypothetical protein
VDARPLQEDNVAVVVKGVAREVLLSDEYRQIPSLRWLLAELLVKVLSLD